MKHKEGPIDEGELRFARLELQVANIPKSMAWLMASLDQNIGPFLEQPNSQ